MGPGTLNGGRPKRALIVVHSYILRDTRPRRFATALTRAGWEVDVVCARDEDEPAREERDGMRIRRLPARRRRGARSRYIYEYLSFTVLAFFAVSSSFLRRKHDAVYVAGIPNLLVFAALLPRIAGARILLDMRDPLPEFFMSKYGLSARNPLVRALRFEERLSARFASAVLTVVPSMARLYERSIPADRVTVIWNVPDPRTFAGSGAQGGPDTRTMLYTGTVAAHYGIDLAVRAIASLRDEIPALRLRVVTKNVHEEGVPALRDLATREGVADRVVIDPPVALEHVAALATDAWIGVQPNRSDPFMDHSLSQKVLEWARIGLPVVCGRTDALSDVFGDDAIMFFEAGNVEGLCDALREAHASPEGLARRAELARAAVDRLNYDEEMKRFLDVVAVPTSSSYTSPNDNREYP